MSFSGVSYEMVHAMSTLRYWSSSELAANKYTYDYAKFYNMDFWLNNVETQLASKAIIDPLDHWRRLLRLVPGIKIGIK